MAAAGDGRESDLRLLNLAAVPCNGMVGTGAGRLAMSVSRIVGKDIQFKEEEP
ncbi:hypothetical protein CDEST_15210 [Colletotrichum destructivum]|uniref:Uncharacterized protein n=1 Tax=Colletotrichum destructivum TaxID=34406 RepID=A0AAX4J3Y8_9PEZI|nr:hypothetical protein CDEST_15210 [Colletotrichum destructivum]